MPDRGRIRDLPYLRCGLHLLRRQESQWSDTGASTRGADLRHNLPALQQHHHSLRGSCAEQEQPPRIQDVSGRHGFAGIDLSDDDGTRVVSTDLREGPDGTDKSLWNNLLLARRSACQSRYRGPYYAFARAHLFAGRARNRGALLKGGDDCSLLALR